MRTPIKATLAGCLFFLCTLTACVDMDPAKTVTVEVSGLASNTESDEVTEILKTMYDKDARYKRTKSRFDGNQLTVEMEPVSDINAFSRRINFGSVTEVSGRTVKITYVRSGSTLRI